MIYKITAFDFNNKPIEIFYTKERGAFKCAREMNAEEYENGVGLFRDVQVWRLNRDRETWTKYRRAMWEK